MFRGKLLNAVAATMLAWLALPVHASSFVDPLDAPAVMSAKAKSSRLVAVTRAGGRLVTVGRLGHILISEDGGKTWQQVPVPVRSDLVSVRFVTPEKGWAVGLDGVVLHSADGGRSWIKQLDGIQIAKIVMAAAEKRAASGDPEASQLLAEGKRFVEDGADKPLFDVLFRNENEGYVVGAFNLALRTRDGGKTWEAMSERIDNPQTMHLYSLAVSHEELYLAGEQGHLWRWDDKTERFVALQSPYKGSFFGALAKDTTLIVFGMQGNAYRSVDGGKTWKKLPTGTSGGITAGTILVDGRIALVTQNGGLIVSADEGDTFAQIKIDRTTPYFGIAPGGPEYVALVGLSGVRMESVK